MLSRAMAVSTSVHSIGGYQLALDMPTKTETGDVQVCQLFPTSSRCSVLGAVHATHQILCTALLQVRVNLVGAFAEDSCDLRLQC